MGETAARRDQEAKIVMMISFIIPAYNEEDYLGKTLECLLASAEAVAAPYEIIVVADGCADGTAAIARKLGARVLEVKLRHIAAVRNAGARIAAGELFIFVDADTLVPERTLRATLQAVRSGAVGGGARLVVDGPEAWPLRLIMQLLACSLRVLRLTIGGYLYVRCDAFGAVGGFDERYFAVEDLVMCRALRKHGRFVVLHEPMITSGRKIEQHTFSEVMTTCARILLRGPRAFRQREGLEIWYGERRSNQGIRAPTVREGIRM